MSPITDDSCTQYLHYSSHNVAYTIGRITYFHSVWSWAWIQLISLDKINSANWCCEYCYVWVTINEVWIGNWIYWTFYTICDYISQTIITYKLVSSVMLLLAMEILWPPAVNLLTAVPALMLQPSWVGLYWGVMQINTIEYRIQQNPRSRMMVICLDWMTPYQETAWDE